jgi:hypothetical protein
MWKLCSVFRLYGMFPCNFLSWLRQQYPESSKVGACASIDPQLIADSKKILKVQIILLQENSVFTSVVAPLLATVRWHALY